MCDAVSDSRADLPFAEQRMIVLALRARAFHADDWWRLTAPAREHLGPDAGARFLLALEHLIATFAEQALRSITLQPLRCFRFSPDEALILNAYAAARTENTAAARDALQRLLPLGYAIQATALLALAAAAYSGEDIAPFPQILHLAAE